MKIAIIISDGRFAYLAKLLTKEGHRVFPVTGPMPDGKEMLSEVDCVVMNYPIRASVGDITYERILEWTKKDAAIFLCGPGFPEKCPDDRRIINLWSDEELVVENAYLTAEGAVASAMQAGSGVIRDNKCLVIGWGRIGSALAEILVALGAKVTVASRSESGRNRAIERGAEAVCAGEYQAFNNKKIIFSTAPAMVLDEKMLRHVERDAMIIDLASPPYGVDLHAAWDLGLRAWREPGLPGRYCPESAACAIYKAMKRSGEMRCAKWMD